MKNIYTLERRGKIGYDEVASFVIVAENPEIARQIAADHAGDEGGQVWLSLYGAVVKPQGRANWNTGTIRANGHFAILCRNFNAG